MKRSLAMVAAAALLLGCAVPLWAQMNPLGGWQAFTNGVPNGQTFQQFVQTHPRIAAELQRNPNALWDPAWRGKHPEVGQWIYHHQPLWNNMLARQGMSAYSQKWQGFLAGRPRLSNALSSNPNLLYDPAWRRNHPGLTQFLQQHPGVRNNLWSSAPTGMYPSTFGNFASNHPGLWNDLKTNPALANDAGYLRQHPDFADFMRNHPGFQQDMRDRAEYWRHHHSYQGWQWHHAWNDAGAEPWMPPGLAHSHGHAYGWYEHHGPGGWGGPGPHGGPGHGPGSGHGPDHGWSHGHGGGWDNGH